MLMPLNALSTHGIDLGLSWLVFAWEAQHEIIQHSDLTAGIAMAIGLSDGDLGWLFPMNSGHMVTTFL
jgi:hypothetical protein